MNSVINTSDQTTEDKRPASDSRPTPVPCLLQSGSGFPHSEISGSKPVRGSPKLIAAYHVLHRLSAPRHPPDTLFALDCARNQKTDCFAASHVGKPQTKETRLGRRASIPSPIRKDQFCFKHI